MKRIIGLSVFALAMVMFACNNEEVDTPSVNDELLSEKSAQVTLNEVKVEAATTESEYEVEFFANMEGQLSRWYRFGHHFQWNPKLRYTASHCPNIAIASEGNDEYPKTITLDYGDSTLLRNGKVLSGVIEIYFSAPRYSQDFEKTVTYNNFSVDSITINGFSTIIIDKVDTLFRQHTSDLTFTLADGTVIERSSERVWQWLAGMDTEDDQSDDVFIITGGASATMTKDGVSDTYSKEIINPLKKIYDCRYIVEGTISITLNGTVVSTLDYGDGECDDIATMTDSEGNVREIDLARHQFRNMHQSGK
ncbi:hypothetical protein [Maribellus sp. YY47]|uniref:hypothetical protein n=1 Tax=Maribellus sp. YY47 TaxID=2929486 RepID=UPI002001912A|nr:hypothetical protein [Maribellus sp. YY47]MCK3683013.1 hypothetical protein [Maribellus sp. YY47]